MVIYRVWRMRKRTYIRLAFRYVVIDSRRTGKRKRTRYCECSIVKVLYSGSETPRVDKNVLGHDGSVAVIHGDTNLASPSPRRRDWNRRRRRHDVKRLESGRTTVMTTDREIRRVSEFIESRRLRPRRVNEPCF